MKIWVGEGGDFISLMEDLQGINLIIDPIYLVLYHIHLPQVLSYTGNYTNHMISKEHIMHELMKITPVYTPRKRKHLGLCKLNKIHKVLLSRTVLILN